MKETELNDKIQRFAELMVEAYKIMEEFNQLYKKCAFKQEDTTKLDSLDLSVKSLELPKNISARFNNACRFYGIETIGDLMVFGREQFENLRNVGRKAVAEVKYALEEQYNLKWG